MASGKSKSKDNPKGIRRKTRYGELAPRSARRKGKHFLDQCAQADITHAEI